MNTDKQKVNDEEAAQIARDHLSKNIPSVSLIDPEAFTDTVYWVSEQKIEDCWLFRVHYPRTEIQVDECYYLLCIHKESGEVVFDGWVG